MTVELSERSLKNIEYLQHKYQLSQTELIDRALELLQLEERDWDLILVDHGLNDDLTEAEADALALEAQRAVRGKHRL
jgi:hypothetical protein